MWWEYEEPKRARRKGRPAPPALPAREEPPAPDYARTLAGVAAGRELGGKKASKTLTLIFGASGYGKSALGAHLYARRFGRGGQCVMLDPTGSHVKLGEEVRTAADLAARVRDYGPAPFSLVFHPHDPEGTDMADFWALVLRRGRLLLFIDELHRFGDAQKIQPGLARVITEGRHRALSVVATVQTPPQMPKIARGNFEALYTFRQTDEDYARQLARGYFGTEHERMIRHLPVLHFLRVDADGHVTRGAIPTEGAR